MTTKDLGVGGMLLVKVASDTEYGCGLEITSRPRPYRRRTTVSVRSVGGPNK